MKIRKSLKALGLTVVVFLIIFPLVVQADFYIKQKNHTDSFSMMGQSTPAIDQIFVTWMGQDKARIDMGEEISIIYRLDNNVMYMIKHAEMIYSEMAIGGVNDIFSSMAAASDLSEDQAQAKEMMQGFAGMMKPTITVTETGESQTIKGWNCKKYDMEMDIMGMTTTAEIWATEDIKIDYDLYRNLTYSIMGSMNQTMDMEDMMEEMKKIKGIVVQQEGTMSMMGSEMKSSQELLEVSNKPAPAGTYTVPEGYEKQK